ncbi:MAG: DEAD/DEAH box helicase, partial [Verrucomicrobia bacterium]|nr:DEAD/DEAH box helicase [Verrucomicrobiota bacterium]
YGRLPLRFANPLTPYPHQTEALAAWQSAGRRGVVVLPTGAGKTFLAQLALAAAARTTLVVVPTLDLLQQWYGELRAAFPGAAVGLLGGGSREFEAPILVSTYASAAAEAERLGNRFGLLVFDEVHHLPTDFARVIAEYSIAPYRLGLTATLARDDGRERMLAALVGPTVFSKTPAELAGLALSPFDEIRLRVPLTPGERARYRELVARRDEFLERHRIRLGSLDGWRRFVRASGRSAAGRAAMLAHRAARVLAFGTEGKLAVLEELLARHAGRRTLIFTDDTAAVYRIAAEFLLPAITHETPVKERHETLALFRSGAYPVLVSSRVLNEGVDVPEASVAIVLSGTGAQREYVQRLGRILRRQEGKRAILYEVIAGETSEEGVAARRRRSEGRELRPSVGEESTSSLFDD